MRDEDTTLAKPAHEELRDIHRRIDLLVEQIHALEVTVARGSRFPAWAGGLLVLAAVQIGGQVYLNAELRGGVTRAMELGKHSVTMLERHIELATPMMTGAARRQIDVDECKEDIRLIEKEIAINTLRLDNIEARNKVADENWNKVRARGLLVESAGGKQ